MDFQLNGKKIPNCMVGTWAWGSGMSGSMFIFGKNYDKNTLKDAFDAAYNAGFNFFDTAAVYGAGNSEKLVGECIKDKEVFVATKHMPNMTYTYGEAKEGLRKSLENLGLESVDLYWVHRPKQLVNTLKELAECVKEGTVKSIGVSNVTLEQLKEARQTLKEFNLDVAAVQNHYSLFTFKEEDEILQYCKQHNILYCAYMVLEQGALSGHYDEKHPFKLFTTRVFQFRKKNFKQIGALLGYIQILAGRYEVDTSQIAIAWAIAKGAIPIVGLTKPSHAKALAKGSKLELIDVEVEELERLAIESQAKPIMYR